MLVDFNSTVSCICLVARTRRQPHCCCCFTLLGLLLLQSLAHCNPPILPPGCSPYSATNRRCFLFISSCRSSYGWSSPLLVVEGTLDGSTLHISIHKPTLIYTFCTKASSMPFCCYTIINKMVSVIFWFVSNTNIFLRVAWELQKFRSLGFDMNRMKLIACSPISF